MVFERNKLRIFSCIQSGCQSKVYLRFDLVRCLFPKCFPQIRVYMVFFVVLSCKSFLYVSSEVSYIFLVLSAKTNILSDELIFFKSFATVS